VARKSKYAAIGSSVRVVTPKQFVRCGYPLSIKMVMDRDFQEIERDCIRMFCALENRPTPEPEPVHAKEWDFQSLHISQGVNMSATVHGMICSAIAAYRLEKENFGGGERQIVEVDGVFEKDQIWTVVDKKFVKTGKRYPSWGGIDSSTGEWDYEPGGLEDEKTYCVYTVTQFSGQYKILAQHCEIIATPKENRQ